MKAQAILSLLIILGLTCAFTITNPNPLPQNMVAGGDYSSIFSISALGPFNTSYQVLIQNADNADMALQLNGISCQYINSSIWDCGNESENSSGIYKLNLTLHLSIYLVPGHFEPILYYSGVEDQPSVLPGIPPRRTNLNGGGYFSSSMMPYPKNSVQNSSPLEENIPSPISNQSSIIQPKNESSKIENQYQKIPINEPSIIPNENLSLSTADEMSLNNNSRNGVLMVFLVFLVVACSVAAIIIGLLYVSVHHPKKEA